MLVRLGLLLGLGLLLVYLVVVVKLSFSGLVLECVVPGPIFLDIYLLVPFVPCMPSWWFPVFVICCNTFWNLWPRPGDDQLVAQFFTKHISVVSLVI